MKKTVIFGVFLFIFAACGPHKPTVAEQRAEKRVKDSLSMVQYAQTMRYTDSLLQTVLPESDNMLKRFKYVKNEKYADRGYYIHPQLQSAGLGQRIYLQAYVTDDFKTVVRSMYYGSRGLKHNRVTLSADSMTNTFYGDLYAFAEDGQHEIVTLGDADAVALLQFVSAFGENKIKVTLSGDRSYAYFLQAKDVAAMVETLRLQTLMSDIRTLEAQYKQASLQYEKYARRLR